jgi:RNA polymerase sigma-B factor
VRVPRRLQELKAEVAKASEELAQRNGVRPSSAQLAVHMGIPEREVAEALEAATAQYATSLQTLVGSSSGEAVELGELLGDVDPALEAVELRLMLRTAMADLAPREQRIIAMRFVDNLTQSEIAEELGISQMHVSRLLTRVLADLRATLTK